MADLSPTKIKQIANPENILKNEIYLMMLRGPSEPQYLYNPNTTDR
jgi:hypothetical protein